MSRLQHYATVLVSRARAAEGEPALDSPRRPQLADELRRIAQAGGPDAEQAQALVAIIDVSARDEGWFE